MAGVHGREFIGQEQGRGRQPDTLAAFPRRAWLWRWIAEAPHLRTALDGHDPDVRAAKAFERRRGVAVFVRPDMRRR